MKAKTELKIPYLEAFGEYIQLLGISEGTQQAVLRTINQFIQWTETENIPIEQVSYNDMLGYVNHCKQKGNSQRTQQIIASHTRHYFNFLIDWGVKQDNPASNIYIKGVKRQFLYETFSPQELEDIYKTYGAGVPLSNGLGHKVSYQRNKLILSLIIYQAVRPEELAKLTVSDIKLQEGKIYIPGARRSNERTLPLESHQLYELMDYIHKIRPAILVFTEAQTDRLFLTLGMGDRFTNIMDKLIRKVREQSPRVQNIKQLRASVISNWLKLHGLRKVQQMAGHKYVSSTEAYQANNMEDLQEDVNRYHPDL